MDDTYPASWRSLKHPWTRRNLLDVLGELSSEEPCVLWAEQRRQGLVADFDQVIHFLFDDVVLDEAGIGYSLFDAGEVRAIASLKEALGTIVEDLPRGTEGESVSHPLWAEVRKRAASAKDRLASR
jgi:hypothetical protein